MRPTLRQALSELSALQKSQEESRQEQKCTAATLLKLQRTIEKGLINNTAANTTGDNSVLPIPSVQSCSIVQDNAAKSTVFNQLE